jgi:hypothetical protein
MCMGVAPLTAVARRLHCGVQEVRDLRRRELGITSPSGVVDPDGAEATPLFVEFVSRDGLLLRRPGGSTSAGDGVTASPRSADRSVDRSDVSDSEAPSPRAMASPLPSDLAVSSSSRSLPGGGGGASGSGAFGSSFSGTVVSSSSGVDGASSRRGGGSGGGGGGGSGSGALAVAAAASVDPRKAASPRRASVVPAKKRMSIVSTPTGLSTPMQLRPAPPSTRKHSLAGIGAFGRPGGASTPPLSPSPITMGRGSPKATSPPLHVTVDGSHTPEQPATPRLGVGQRIPCYQLGREVRGSSCNTAMPAFLLLCARLRSLPSCPQLRRLIRQTVQPTSCAFVKAQRASPFLALSVALSPLCARLHPHTVVTLRCGPVFGRRCRLRSCVLASASASWRC